MRLVAATVSAVRMPTNERPEVSVQNVIALIADDDTDIDAALNKQAHQVFPAAEGWGDHDAIFSELEQGMAVGPYRLTWQIEVTA